MTSTEHPTPPQSDELRITEESLRKLDALLERKGGMVILAGPLGSGHMTTAFSSLTPYEASNGTHA